MGESPFEAPRSERSGKPAFNGKILAEDRWRHAGSEWRVGLAPPSTLAVFIDDELVLIDKSLRFRGERTADTKLGAVRVLCRSGLLFARVDVFLDGACIRADALRAPMKEYYRRQFGLNSLLKWVLWTSALTALCYVLVIVFKVVLIVNDSKPDAEPMPVPAEGNPPP